MVKVSSLTIASPSRPGFEIEGVPFFDSPASCIAHFEAKPWIEKALLLIQCIGTLFLYLIYKIGLILYGVESRMEPLINPELSKKRLVVCIHGLNNNPSQFKKIVDEVNTPGVSRADTDVFIPRVLEKGHAKLDEMVQPIFDRIADWAKLGGDRELVLVGVSNGGRIGRAIEAKIANLGSSSINKLHFVSIVGACRGSYLVDIVHYLGLSWLLSKNIAEEMPTDSARNKQLNQDWEEALSKGPQREYTFIASPHDPVVPNYDSTLMDVKGRKARYALIPGHGHGSVVDVVAKVVAQIIMPPIAA